MIACLINSLCKFTKMLQKPQKFFDLWWVIFVGLFFAKLFLFLNLDPALLSIDKTIFSLLELIDNGLSISECFGKTLVAFDFDEKLT